MDITTNVAIKYKPPMMKRILRNKDFKFISESIVDKALDSLLRTCHGRRLA
jgi:hypothetical protein